MIAEAVNCPSMSNEGLADRENRLRAMHSAGVLTDEELSYALRERLDITDNIPGRMAVAGEGVDQAVVRAAREYSASPMSPGPRRAMHEALLAAINHGHRTKDQLSELTGIQGSELSNLLNG
jgi:hypothetical protein